MKNIVKNSELIRCLGADFFKFFKCRVYNKNSIKSAENLCDWREIIGTNNWIRLLIFNNES